MIPDLFSHQFETGKANQAIYNEQKTRLSVNAFIILFCLLDGQHLSAIDFVGGIQFDGMNRKKVMCEYRRRLCELRDGGIQIKYAVCIGGYKVHNIEDNLRAAYLAKYEPHRLELLAKINKA